jgi:hypothetical protein
LRNEGLGISDVTDFNQNLLPHFEDIKNISKKKILVFRV